MECNNSLKRKDYIDWPNYFMGVAVLSSQRSKDPNTQVGVCIANVENKIVGVGYNGFPIGCSDDEFPWDRSSTNQLDNKYMYVVHAEVNAIMNKGVADVKNGILYTTEFPCNECAKIIIQSGIKEIFYLSEKYPDNPQTIASKRMLNAVGIKYLKFEPTVKQIVIDFNYLCNK